MIQIPSTITPEYAVVPTGSRSSIVLARGDEILKLTQRNPLGRLVADYETLLDRLSDFPDRVLPSWFGETVYGGEKYAVVAQRRFDGTTLVHHSSGSLNIFYQEVWENQRTGAENSRFVLALIDWLLEATGSGCLYPDPVGCPENPILGHSQNLLVAKEDMRLVLCDVGLSPHADTAARDGAAFYDGNNVLRYRNCMQMVRGYIERCAT
jgi:hypothetical protein